MVLHLLGQEQAAKYYVAMTIGNLALIVPSALSLSLFIEGSHGQPLKQTIIKTGKTAYLFLLPFVLIEEKYRFVFIVFFLFLYELSLLTLHGFELRIIPYYGLVAIMGTLILAQILFFRSTTRIQNVTIIFQIIMLFLNIVWGVTLKYYFFIGRTDIFFHSWLVENLLTTGHINPVFDVYEAFPLFHILSAIIYEICGFSIGPHKVLFITNGIIFTGLLIIIYLLVIRIADKKTAQLAALFA
jgi:hypothetical protein